MHGHLAIRSRIPSPVVLLYICSAAQRILLLSKEKARGRVQVVLFIVAVQQVVIGVCLDAKALVCSQEEMLVN